jgi:antitoxin component YwqK of YwqJK toxin-antitoxin module
MKTVFISCFLLLASLCALSQKVGGFVDSWPVIVEAATRYFIRDFEMNKKFSTIILNTDSGWNRHDHYIPGGSLKMKGLFQDSLCFNPHGWFYIFYPNGQVFRYGKYNNRKKEGLWLSFYDNGIMQDSIVYKNGRPAGILLRWHSNTYLSDSVVWNEDESGVKVSWFDNGAPSSSGRFVASLKKHGNWVYYHKNGLVSCREKYDSGKLAGKKYFNEDGLALQDTISTLRTASFKGGKEKWLNYMDKRMRLPITYLTDEIVKRGNVTVVVQAIIDEEGNLKEAHVLSSIDPYLTGIALDVIRNSPKWNPAIDQYNRRIKYYLKQPVTFKIAH